jgi:hypothetical protein
MSSKKKSTKAVRAELPSAAEETVIAVKGFDENLRCREFQFEVGKTYEHAGKIEICASGFHACEHPLDVLRYYPSATSRFAVVTQSGSLARHTDDTKVASAKITIEAEIQLPQLIERAVKWVFDRAKWSEGPVATGQNEGVTASGYSGAATASGYSGAATASGVRGAATASGYSGAATASGDRGAATASGYSGAATASGDSGAATASGYSGAATASGDSGAATASGDRGAATASGDSGAATASGVRGAATASGYSGAATASGYSGAVRGADGCALFLVYRDQKTWNIVHAWAGIAGRGGIKPMTWYILDATGKPIETEV